MAESKPLSERISENLLQCTICYEPFQNPKVLPCLHGFCARCLEDWSKTCPDKDKIICPTCRNEVVLPDEGVKWLPGHFLVNSLKDICNEEKTPVVCDNCDETTKKRAAVYCNDCKENLCTECHTLHEALKEYESHAVEQLYENIIVESRYCKDHNQIIVEFYCETEQRQVCSHCLSLNTCQAHHTRLSLQDAGKKLFSDIVRLLSEYDRLKQEHEFALQKTEQVREDLMKSKESALSTLSKTRNENIQRLDDIFKRNEDDIEKDNLDQVEEIATKEQHLQQNLAKVDNMLQKGSKAVHSESEYEITSTCSGMIKTFEMLKMEPAEAAEPKLAHLNYVPAPSALYNISNMMVKRQWEPAGKFTTRPHLKDLCGVAINRDGDIAVTSIRNGIGIFKRTGQLKCSFKDAPETAFDIDVTPDNRYIIDGKNAILFYDSNGYQLAKITTTDLNRDPCKPHGLTTDTRGRIIAALQNKCISIHYSDGSIINKIGIQSVPWRLAVTSTGELVVSCYNSTLKLVDYNGGHVKDIQPPPGITRWNPGYVCCCHKYGEIFVGSVGVPKAVYCYTSDGEYVGLVTDDVNMPQGIAISEDGRELLIAELNENRIKIFNRQ